MGGCCSSESDPAREKLIGNERHVAKGRGQYTAAGSINDSGKVRGGMIGGSPGIGGGNAAGGGGAQAVGGATGRVAAEYAQQREEDEKERMRAIVRSATAAFIDLSEAGLTFDEDAANEAATLSVAGGAAGSDAGDVSSLGAGSNKNLASAIGASSDASGVDGAGGALRLVSGSLPVIDGSKQGGGNVGKAGGATPSAFEPPRPASQAAEDATSLSRVLSGSALTSAEEKVSREMLQRLAEALDSVQVKPHESLVTPFPSGVDTE